MTLWDVSSAGPLSGAAVSALVLLVGLAQSQAGTDPASVSDMLVRVGAAARGAWGLLAMGEVLSHTAPSALALWVLPRQRPPLACTAHRQRLPVALPRAGACPYPALPRLAAAGVHRTGGAW